jgi:hypothetical protein
VEEGTPNRPHEAQSVCAGDGARMDSSVVAGNGRNSTAKEVVVVGREPVQGVGAQMAQRAKDGGCPALVQIAHAVGVVGACLLYDMCLGTRTGTWRAVGSWLQVRFVGEAEEAGAEGSLADCTLLSRDVEDRQRGNVRAFVGSMGTAVDTRMAWWRVEDYRGDSEAKHLAAGGSAGELGVAREQLHLVSPQVV